MSEEHDILADSEPQFEPVVPHEEDEVTPLARLAGDPEDRYLRLPPKIRPGSIFDQKPTSGLFTQPQSTQVSHLGWGNSLTREPAMDAQEPMPSEIFAASGPVTPRIDPVLAEIEPVASERIAGAPLGDLSHVELLERLALSMQRKRPATSTPEAPADESFSAASGSEPVESDVDLAEEAFAAPSQPPVPVVPDALRPIGLDDDADGDLLPAFVPPRHFGLPQDRIGSVRAEVPAATQTDEHRLEEV